MTGILSEIDRVRRVVVSTSVGMTDDELADALAFELGIMGGSSGAGEVTVCYQGAGLKIWISWEVENLHTTKPVFEGKATIAMARLVYGIPDPSDAQLSLF